jgi:hypothetical protein
MSRCSSSTEALPLWAPHPAEVCAIDPIALVCAILTTSAHLERGDQGSDVRHAQVGRAARSGVPPPIRETTRVLNEMTELAMAEVEVVADDAGAPQG